ncbi:MAG: glycosyl hydrolase family 28 protein [Candidatus Malihini olakiniferum]
MLVENNQFEGSMYGIRIKMLHDKSGEVKNITYRYTKIVNVDISLAFLGYYKATPIVYRSCSFK